jgi:hypothetical protein
MIVEQGRYPASPGKQQSASSNNANYAPAKPSGKQLLFILTVKAGPDYPGHDSRSASGRIPPFKAPNLDYSRCPRRNCGRMLRTPLRTGCGDGPC